MLCVYEIILNILYEKKMILMKKNILDETLQEIKAARVHNSDEITDAIKALIKDAERAAKGEIQSYTYEDVFSLDD